MAKKKRTLEERAVGRIYSEYKSRAKRKKTDFRLTKAEVHQLVISSCMYCGAESSNEWKVDGEVFGYNGIDRKDSSSGYLVENCVTSCRFCNSLKASMNWETWASFINAVVARHHGHPPFVIEADENYPALSFYRFM